MVNKTLSASSWNLHWDLNKRIAPSVYGTTWRFKFPTANPPIGYVHRGSGGSILPYKVMRIQYNITGDGQLIPNDNDKPPARLALYFQRQYDDWQATPGKTEMYRWWSNTRTPLVLGPTTIEIPLTGDKWKSVNTITGTMNPSMFSKAKEKCARIGFTLGGVGSAGHGVKAIGTAYFEIIGFWLE